MIFTGKAKEKFEEWYCTKSKYKYSIYYLQKALTNFKVFSELEMLQMFYSSGLSMQIGVIEDFAESLEYSIVIEKENDSFTSWINSEDSGNRDYDTRNKARLGVINQLNEILNNL